MTERVDTQYAREALTANNETFTTDALQSARVNTFDRILTQLGTQRNIQRNEETPRADGVSPDGTRSLYVSQAGFLTLSPGIPSPRMLYVDEGLGAASRPEEYIQEVKVDQVVLHSFGYSIDHTALNNGAQSIQVDNPETGHNPYKFANRIAQVLFRPNQSTTHLISRRGDIVSAAPWNRAPAVNKSRPLHDLRPEMRSISIELESWHTTYKQNFNEVSEADFRILGMMPYTHEQLAALAFLLKKLSLWADGADTSHVLGFTRHEVEAVLGDAENHAAGILPAAAYLGTNAGPGGEFMLPPGWKLGDPLPAHMQRHRAVWDKRHDLYYRPGFAEGTQISSFYEVQQLISLGTLPDFDVTTDLFETRDETIFAAAHTGDGIGSPATAAIAAAGEGYARAQSMQGASRSGLYSAAPINADAVITAAAEAQARRTAAAFTTPSIPVVQNAISFDFTLGAWVVQTVASPVPAAAAPTEGTETPPAEPPTPPQPSALNRALNLPYVQTLGRLH